MADDLETHVMVGHALAEGNGSSLQSNSERTSVLPVLQLENGERVCEQMETTELEEDVTEDILQQALAEASAGALDHIEQTDVNIDSSAYECGENQISVSNNVAEHSSSHTSQSSLQEISPQTQSSINVTTLPGSQQQAGTPLTEKIVKTSAPLGSKTNPIRIIQQGNTYTSMQQLSEAQIQQIVRVLQQQNIAARSVDGTPTTVFNPETNTRIVYRVVQPAGGQTVDVLNADGTITRQQYHPSKYGGLNAKSRKRQKPESEDDEPSTDTDVSQYEGESDSDPGEMPLDPTIELTPAEKLKKKREKPITRSGRVSKPPSHMVKDYKQIHRVDWYEDFDDDDGGYSDIYDSDTERDKSNSLSTDDKRRRFGCEQCQKAYIGAAGLARHFKLTGHGDPTELLKSLEKPEDQNVPVVENMTQDSNLSTGSSSTAATLDLSNSTQPNTQGQTPMMPRGRGRPRKKVVEEDAPWRPPAHMKSITTQRKVYGKPSSDGLQSHRGPGRPALSPAERWQRRAEKLDNVLSSYSTKEILEVVTARMAADKVTLFDILDAGLATQPSEPPSFTIMLQRYNELQSKMTELAQICLRPITEGAQVAEDKEAIQIANDVMAHSIGVQPGLFEVSALPGHEKVEEVEPATDNMSRDGLTEIAQSSDKVEGEGQSNVTTQMAHSLFNNAEYSNSPVTTATTAMVQTQKTQNLVTTTTTLPLNKPAKSLLTQALKPQISSVPRQAPMVSHVPVQEPIHKTLAQIEPGDILQLDGGQSIVIPEGARIVQTADGIVIYQPENVPQLTAGMI